MPHLVQVRKDSIFGASMMNGNQIDATIWLDQPISESYSRFHPTFPLALSTLASNRRNTAQTAISSFRVLDTATT